jgi:hypothetical protein
MGKKRSDEKMRLRKETLRALEQRVVGADDLARVVGGRLKYSYMCTTMPTVER